jgi:hypothetical protein
MISAQGILLANIKHNLLNSIVFAAKNARYSSVAFSTTSEYADPNSAIKTLTKMMVARKFQL